MVLRANADSLDVVFPKNWLDENQLTQADFAQEAEWLTRVGFTLNVR